MNLLARPVTPLRTLLGVTAVVALGALAAACGRPARADAGVVDAPALPAECSGCPDDCCRVGDGGFACLEWSRRNPTTFECGCGAGPACDPGDLCCPPNTDPLPLQPPVCAQSRSQCDPRPSM